MDNMNTQAVNWAAAESWTPIIASDGYASDCSDECFGEGMTEVEYINALLREHGLVMTRLNARSRSANLAS